MKHASDIAEKSYRIGTLERRTLYTNLTHVIPNFCETISFLLEFFLGQFFNEHVEFIR